jgi:hypothetical protein
VTKPSDNRRQWIIDAAIYEYAERGFLWERSDPGEPTETMVVHRGGEMHDLTSAERAEVVDIIKRSERKA